jgi:YidC/Oxa1 family membrane protein insertase
LDIIGQVWQIVILNPVINVLIVLAHYMFGSFGLAIIVLTVFFNLLLYPITRKQMKATKAQQDLAPKLAEMRKKYAKDSQKLAQEQMKMYRESGISPAGCLLPMLIQMPLWIAFYQAIIRVTAATPESFVNLSGFLYHWPIVFSALPVNTHFLWLNLAAPDTLLAVLVGLAMWVQQKMTVSAVGDPQAQAQAQTMQIMMPVMFGFISMSVASGLAVYWVVSNILRIAMQYRYSGWGGLSETFSNLKNRFLPGKQGKPPQKYIKK